MCKFLILIQQNKLFGNEPVKCTFLHCMYTKQYIKKKVHTLINKKNVYKNFKRFSFIIALFTLIIYIYKSNSTNKSHNGEQ